MSNILFICEEIFMEKIRKWFLLFICILPVLSGCGSNEDDKGNELQKETCLIKIETIEVERKSRQAICLSWSESYDNAAESYLVKRRERKSGQSIGEWTVLATIPSDKTLSNGDWYYTDELESDKPQQYEYRIDMEIADKKHYIAEEGKSVLGFQLVGDHLNIICF